jgi:hypothetical protein
MIVELEISLSFDEFGLSALEGQARADGLELDQLIALACSYYESELGSGRTAMRAPRFAQPANQRESRTLELDMGAKTRRRLEQEAVRQGIGLERLFEHAAMLYLADVDAGRVTERILRVTGR